MAAFNKFQVFVQDVGLAVHNLNTATLKVALSNTAPVNTNTILANITQIANGNGYTTGGATVATTAYAHTAGVGELSGADVVFTASGAVGPFRYAVLYNDTAANDPLIGWWDYGSAVTLASGETFTVDFGATILTLT